MLVKLDAIFEGLLGLALLLAASAGALDSGDFPSPVGTVVLLLAGWALLTLCALIWNGRVGLKALVVGNGLTAVAGLVWLLAAGGWSGAGATLVGVAVGALAVLAAAQAATLRA
jgi:hypothetical protein